MSSKRYKMGKRSSKKSFKKGTGIHKMNLRPRPMRGGTRL
jgi:hypothetical protein